MNKNDLLKVGKYLLIGIIVAIGGIFFSDLYGNIFNGSGDYRLWRLLSSCALQSASAFIPTKLAAVCMVMPIIPPSIAIPIMRRAICAVTGTASVVRLAFLVQETSNSKCQTEL